MLPVLAILAVFLLLGALGWLEARGSSAEQWTRAGICYLNYPANLGYSAAILDSSDLCENLGVDHAGSGRVMGYFWNGALAGVALAWLLVRWQPEHWRRLPRSMIFASLGLHLPCALVYCYVAAEAAEAGPRPGLVAALAASRLVTGVGSGLFFIVGLSSLMHVTPLPERKGPVASFVLCFALALGTGPIFAGVLHALDGQPGPRFMLTAYMQLASAVGALVLAAAMPGRAGFVDCEEEQEQGAFGRPCVVLSCWAMTLLREMAVAALQLELTLALELRGWSRRHVGLVTGAAFLCTIPALSLQRCSGGAVVAWIRASTLLALLGVLLLFGFTERLLPGSLHLVAAAPCVWAGLFTGDALTMSLMYQHTLPRGSMLDADFCSLASNALQVSGSSLGCWLGRLLLERKGEQAFALGELGALLLFLGIFEVLLRPSLAPELMQLLKRPQAAGEALLSSPNADG